MFSLPVCARRTGAFRALRGGRGFAPRVARDRQTRICEPREPRAARVTASRAGWLAGVGREMLPDGRGPEERVRLPDDVGGLRFPREFQTSLGAADPFK